MKVSHMTGISSCRSWRRLPGPVLAALAVAPVTAAADTGGGPAQATALTQAFQAARDIPGSAIGGIRPGTLHTGAADGTEWAIASFTPAAPTGTQVAAGFQDGAGTGIFKLRSGRWRLVKTGPYGCGDGLPAALKTAWGLAEPAGCTAAIATQRAAAQRALSALPAAQAGLGQTIASIALSQVGVSDTPAVTAFALDCNPFSTLTAGFSANSDGCGSDATFGVRDGNETWCSDFNKWVWERITPGRGGRPASGGRGAVRLLRIAGFMTGERRTSCGGAPLPGRVTGSRRPRPRRGSRGGAP